MANNKKNKSRKQQRGRRQKNRSRGITAPTMTNTLWRKFRYADSGYITEASAGAGAAWIFRTADLYDPDYSGGGHQPMYFDQLVTSTGPYLAFSVPRAKFTIVFTNVTAYPAIVALNARYNTTTPPTRTNAQESANSWTKLLAPQGTTGAMIKHTILVDNTLLIGYPVPAFYTNSVGNAGSSAASPFLYIQTFAPAGVATASSVLVNVIVEFDARLSQLGPIATS